MSSEKIQSKTNMSSTQKSTETGSSKDNQSINTQGMTPENAKAMDILCKEGSDEAVKYMFNPTGKRQLSYAEMRSMFG